MEKAKVQITDNTPLKTKNFAAFVRFRYEPVEPNLNSSFMISAPYQTGLCSHSLCKYYFFDSLTNFNESFGVKCSSYEDFEKKNCNSYETEIAGFYSRKT